MLLPAARSVVFGVSPQKKHEETWHNGVTLNSMCDMLDWGNTIDFSTLMLAVDSGKGGYMPVKINIIKPAKYCRWFSEVSKNQARNTWGLSTSPSKQSACRSCKFTPELFACWMSPKSKHNISKKHLCMLAIAPDIWGVFADKILIWHQVLNRSVTWLWNITVDWSQREEQMEWTPAFCFGTMLTRQEKSEWMIYCGTHVTWPFVFYVARFIICWSKLHLGLQSSLRVTIPRFLQKRRPLHHCKPRAHQLRHGN